MKAHGLVIIPHFVANLSNPLGSQKIPFTEAPVFHQKLCAFSPYGTVPVPCRGQDRVHGALSAGDSSSYGCFQ
jgi:hypothetical protein